MLATTHFGDLKTSRRLTHFFLLELSRILDFSTTTLTVRIYKANEFVIKDEASSPPASTDNSQASAPTNDSLTLNTTTNGKSKRKQAPAYSSSGTRQSKRIKAGKVHYDERRFSEVSKDTTVLDLKLKASLNFYSFPMFGMLCRFSVCLTEMSFCILSHLANRLWNSRVLFRCAKSCSMERSN